MRNKIKLLLISLGIIAGAMAFHAPAVSAQSASESVCKGIGVLTESGECDESSSSGPSVNSIIRTTITILSFLIGIISVIMIMVGAFKYITSGGDSGKVTSAKNTIVYALIGLVIAALAQVLVRYVLTQATKTPTNTNTTILQSDDPSVDTGNRPLDGAF
jgi:hypothetical protein